MPQAAFVIGILASFFAFFSALVLKKYGIDDVLDVTALQAVPGITGNTIHLISFTYASPFMSSLSFLFFFGHMFFQFMQLSIFVVSSLF